MGLLWGLELLGGSSDAQMKAFWRDVLKVRPRQFPLEWRRRIIEQIGSLSLDEARAYYDVLKKAEVPRLRLVANQDFSFTPGIDVTDVRQTKGLEFDIVILLEVTEESYPVSDLSRRLLHVAMTRGAHQLWITFTGRPSALLPDDLAL